MKMKYGLLLIKKYICDNKKIFTSKWSLKQIEDVSYKSLTCGKRMSTKGRC